MIKVIKQHHSKAKTKVRRLNSAPSEDSGELSRGKFSDDEQELEYYEVPEDDDYDELDDESDAAYDEDVNDIDSSRSYTLKLPLREDPKRSTVKSSGITRSKAAAPRSKTTKNTRSFITRR